MTRSDGERKSPVFTALLRGPTPAVVSLLNNLHTDDFDLLTRLALKVSLTFGGVASVVPGARYGALARRSKNQTQKQRAIRAQLEKELSLARRASPFARSGAFIPRQTGEGIPAPKWLPRFIRMELELRDTLKRLPGYSRLCVCRKCEKFFIRKTARHRDYCSRKCAGNASAQTTMERKRAVERAIALKRVRAALRSCPPGCDPSEWAATKARVTKNWITYAVARGEVKL
jgi:hypothetical protein